MKLHKLKYKEFSNDPTKNPWELKGLIFDGLNLIVGKNATGKSRTINVIRNLANIINTPNFGNIKNGDWEVELSERGINLKYELSLVEGKVIREKIVINDEAKLDKTNDVTTIKPTGSDWKKIDPPDDKLVLHIRRDKTEYPFFEYLYEWADHFNSYIFSNVDPRSVLIPTQELRTITSLSFVPQAFEKLSPEGVKEAIKDFNRIGYKIEDIKLDIAPGLPFNVKILYVKESKLNYYITQSEMSTGMFCSLALIIIIHYLLEQNKDQNFTISVDDLCDGLDYERATELAKLLFELLDKTNIQFIATSNAELLMNAVDIKYWNILSREGASVKALNFENSKEAFNKFKLTGLSNFDLFSSDFLNISNG